jgi:hypothetical protein
MTSEFWIVATIAIAEAAITVTVCVLWSLDVRRHGR